MEVVSTEQSVTNSGTRMPQSPRRPTHQLPPRLNIHPGMTSELGPPAQVPVCNNFGATYISFVQKCLLCQFQPSNSSNLSCKMIHHSVSLFVESLSSLPGRRPAL